MTRLLPLGLFALWSAAAFAADRPLAVEHPHYVPVTEQTIVHGAVDQVWTRVGGFCAGPQTPCPLRGSGSPGTVRSAGSEVLVGETEHSYTYAQPPRQGLAYALPHGTLAAEAVTASTTRLLSTSVQDDSVLPDEAARAAELQARHARAPRYVSLPMRIVVDAPVDKVWVRVGKYCDIGEWGFPGCTLLSGKDGELGTVRSIGTEVLVGQTRWSYTYAQPLRTGGAYTLYHGTLEARPLDPARTTLFYTLLWDNSSEPDEAARAKDLDRRRTLFEGFLRNMKTLAEGGTVPPGALGPR